MEIFLFDERQGSGFAASAARDGSDLPGGASAWKPCGSIRSTDPALPPDVAGVGEVGRIVDAVEATGTFITTRPERPTHGAA